MTCIIGNIFCVAYLKIEGFAVVVRKNFGGIERRSILCCNGYREKEEAE